MAIELSMRPWVCGGALDGSQFKMFVVAVYVILKFCFGL